MKKILLCLSLCASAILPPVYAQSPAKPISGHKCTSSPCGNTATGEDPQEQRIHEGALILDKIRNGDDDQLRWTSISLYSDSSDPKHLSMPLVKAAGLEMRLYPKLGHLSFSKQGRQHMFSIASPLGSKNSICPQYVIDVVEASAAHALLRMACLKTETAPGRYHMGVEYYLYDLETATMREIWRAAVQDKNAHMPDAKPKPTLKIIPNGYRFDWKGVQPSDNPPSITTLHNSYTRSTDKSGVKGLLCTNLSAPKGEGVEDDMCEGGILPLVVKNN